jgi:hypothetical protein
MEKKPNFILQTEFAIILCKIDRKLKIVSFLKVLFVIQDSRFQCNHPEFHNSLLVFYYCQEKQNNDLCRISLQKNNTLRKLFDS